MLRTFATPVLIPVLGIVWGLVIVLGSGPAAAKTPRYATSTEP